MPPKRAEGKKKHPCPVPGCGSEFDEQKYLDRHDRDIHQTKSIKCPHCPLLFATIESVNTHVGMVHQNKTQKCDITGCTKEYVSKSRLTKHKKDHAANPHMCLLCESLFPNQTELDTHMITHPAGQVKEQKLVLTPDPNAPDPNKPWKCKHCVPPVYFTRPGLRTHHVSQHVQKKKLRCRVCPAEFSDEKAFNKHIRDNHDPNAIRCPDCGQSFGRPSDFQNHKRGNACPAAKAKDKDKAVIEKDKGKEKGSSEPQTPVERSFVGKPSEPEDNIGFLRRVLGEQVHLDVLDKLNTIKELVGLRLEQTEPSNPTPGAIDVMGPNLKKFQALLYKDPLWAVSRPGADPNENLTQFLSRDPQCEIYSFYRIDDKTGYVSTLVMADSEKIDEPGLLYDSCEIDVTEDWLTEDDAMLICDELAEIVARTPCRLKEFGKPLQRWALASSMSLCSKKHADFLLKLPCPVYVDRWAGAADSTKNTQAQHVYMFRITGYDAEHIRPWTSSFYVRVGVVDMAYPLSVPDNIEWKGEYQEPAALKDSSYTQQDFRKAYDTARMLSARYFRAIGTKEDVLRRVRDDINGL